VSDHGQTLPAALSAAKRIAAREASAPSSNFEALAVSLEGVCAGNNAATASAE